MNRKTEYKLFFFIWLVYAIFATPAGGVTPNRYVDLVHAIVNEGRFEIDTYHENTIDKSIFQGHYYAGALPGPSFLAVPIYLIYKGIYTLLPENILSLAGGVQSFKAGQVKASGFYQQVDTVEFFLSQVFLNIFVLAAVSAAGCVFLYRAILEHGMSRSTALKTTFFYAFGSIIFFYSTTFFEQVFSATLAIGSFYFLYRYFKQSGKQDWNSFLSGFLAGCGLLVEYTTVFFSGWLGLGMLIKKEKRAILLFGSGFLIPLIILMSYQFSIFGNPFLSPYMFLIEEHQSVHGIGFFGATYPRLERLYEITLGQERGLFLFIPITLMGFAGLASQVKAGKPFRFSALISTAILLTYLIFYSAYENWRGGAAFGPRYLTPALPFLFLGVAFSYKIVAGWVVDSLGILSILINWLGAQYGFAVSFLDHFKAVFQTGPALPVFGVILSHSTDSQGQLFQLVSAWHVPVTLVITLSLLALGLFAFRKELFQPS